MAKTRRNTAERAEHEKATQGTVRKGTSTTIMTDLHPRLVQICNYKGVHAYEYLDPLIRETINADFMEMVKKLNEQAKDVNAEIRNGNKPPESDA